MNGIPIVRGKFWELCEQPVPLFEESVLVDGVELVPVLGRLLLQVLCPGLLHPGPGAGQDGLLGLLLLLLAPGDVVPGVVLEHVAL